MFVNQNPHLDYSITEITYCNTAVVSISTTNTYNQIVWKCSYDVVALRVGLEQTFESLA